MGIYENSVSGRMNGSGRRPCGRWHQAVHLDRVRALEPDPDHRQQGENTSREGHRGPGANSRFGWAMYATWTRPWTWWPGWATSPAPPTGLESWWSITAAFDGLVPCSPRSPPPTGIWRDPPWMAAGGDTFIDDMLRRCGLWERVPVRDPLSGHFPRRTGRCRPGRGAARFRSPSRSAKSTSRRCIGLLPGVPVRLVDGEAFSWYGAACFTPRHTSAVCCGDGRSGAPERLVLHLLRPTGPHVPVFLLFAPRLRPAVPCAPSRVGLVLSGGGASGPPTSGS